MLWKMKEEKILELVGELDGNLVSTTLFFFLLFLYSRTKLNHSSAASNAANFSIKQ